MEALLNYISQKFITIDPEYIKFSVFIFDVLKCTFLFMVCMQLVKWVIERLFKKIAISIESPERVRQVLTLKTLLMHTLRGIIFAVYVGNLLSLFGIDVRPILATAGVMGVAIGFGAKRFVEDVITGLMILVEGQIRVGDYVEIQGMKGFVEKITLNLVTVRSDVTGAIYFIRCGYIDSIMNYTMNYSFASFYFDVAYKENIDHVIHTIEHAYSILCENEEYKKLILSDIEIFGLDKFKDSSLCIRCRIKTQPKGQWTIQRAFNKIIKEQFDAENIEIPFNQVVVTNVNSAV